jgi:hypothetical protein
MIAFCSQWPRGPNEPLADDAVHIEPVSAFDSLITGKNTGKLTKADPCFGVGNTQIRRVRWAFSTRFLESSNREFLEKKQGNQSREQGIYP